MSFWNFYLSELKNLEKMGASVFPIGESVLKRPIFCVKIGSGKKKILVQYSIHAREHITFFLSILHAKKLLKENVCGTVFLIPLTNPDGVCLCFDGLKSVDESVLEIEKTKNLFPFCRNIKGISLFKRKKIKKNLEKVNGKRDFSLWKANINCVDLNVNFDAHFGKGKQNVFSPASENYVGPFPESEPETKSLVSFFKAVKPDMTISYHSKGEIIFFKFHQKKKEMKRDKLIAKEISKLTGYCLKQSPNSTGGFKDFCILKNKIPSFTIEVGKDSLSHPISKKHLLGIWKRNEKVIEKSLALLNSFDV